LVGSLALIGTPFFSGFYSKDEIIMAVHASHLPASGFAYFAVMAGVFVTAFYSFRLYFLVFHGTERYDQNPDTHHGHDDHSHAHDSHAGQHHPKESPWVVTVPLIMLAIPSLLIGYYTIGPMLFGDFFKDAIFVNSEIHHGMEVLSEEFHGAEALAAHGFSATPFWLMVNPALPAAIKRNVLPLYKLLENKYYMDWFNENVLARGTRGLGVLLWKVGDQTLIDGAAVNGSWRVVGLISSVVRKFQTGFLYDYALTMVLGIFVLMTYFVWLK
jgi:NADH-quinone oxidoreductase subunit L